VKRWAIYAGSAALLVGLFAVSVGFMFEPPVRQGIWLGLAAAWLVQVVAFAVLLVATRRQAKNVVAGWTLGTFIRLATLTALAWLTLSEVWAFPPEPTLIALVGGLFALLLLEPVFYRYRFEAR
jgi:hypothetical protein